MQNPKTLFMGQNLIHLSVVDSTNNFAANMVKQTKVIHGTAILADNQTKGRGQSGNSWEVEPNSNLTFSLILEPKLELSEQFQISKITCLAIIDTIENLGVSCTIKWPNDIFINSRKVAGILIENTIKGKQIDKSIVGIGLNLNQEFDGYLNATSLKEVLGTELNREKVFHSLLKHLEIRYMQLERGNSTQIDDSYLRKLFGLNQKRIFNTKEAQFHGTIKGVNSLGQLEILDQDENLRTFNNQEIKFILN